MTAVDLWYFDGRTFRLLEAYRRSDRTSTSTPGADAIVDSVRAAGSDETTTRQRENEDTGPERRRPQTQTCVPA
jgi:hypothetical protein